MPDPGGSRRADPLALARAHAAPERIKRFYKSVECIERNGRFTVCLDGRPARTPGRRPLAAPHRAAGGLIAAEWAGQGTHLDLKTMPATRLANTAIDAVAARMEAVRADILAYAGTDLVCYRAGEPAGLAERQSAAWDPVLAHAEARLSARFALGEGVMHVAQPAAALAAVGTALAEFDEPFRLAALHVATTLSGSALIALMLAHGGLAPDDAWTAAHVDEQWNIEQWGEDAEAAARQAVRRAEFDAAAAFLRD